MTLFALFNLIELDQQLFHLLNAEWTNGILDMVLPIWRDKYFWLPVYIFIIAYALYNYGKRGYWFLVFLILTCGSADLISNQLIKKNVQRVRPCNNAELLEVRSLVSCGSGYSFTSNHAANHFSLSFFIMLTMGKRRKWLTWVLVGWAASIAYGQVYVGVHFPLDVLSGAILGVLIARCMSWLYYRSGYGDIHQEVALA